MFLTIQLVHLTCRKDNVQSPTRKEGWDLFQRTSDNSSNTRWRRIWRYFQKKKRPQTQCNYVTLLSDIIDVEPSSYEEATKKKGKENTSSRRMMSRMQYQDLKGIPYKLAMLNSYEIRHLGKTLISPNWWNQFWSNLWCWKEDKWGYLIMTSLWNFKHRAAVISDIPQKQYQEFLHKKFVN